MYCTDTILDQHKKITLDITAESLARVESEKKPAKVPDSRTVSAKASPMKIDLRGTMDAEA